MAENMYDRIMKVLNDRGETPGHMCNKLGVRRAMMSELRSKPDSALSARMTAAVADYLHVTCDYLICGRELDIGLTPVQTALVKAWDKASDTERENVAFILRNHGFSYTTEVEASEEEKLA